MAAPTETLGEPQLPANATDEDLKVASAAYAAWADQFPIAAACKTFYGVPCGPLAVQSRFFTIAAGIGIPTQEALAIFQPDLWVLTLTEEKFQERLEALRSVSTSQDEMLEFLRSAPRTLGTTTAAEIRERGLTDMRLRAALGSAWEALGFPVRFVTGQLAKATAARAMAAVGEGETASEEDLQAFTKSEANNLDSFGRVFFGSIFAFVLYLVYMDTMYGGPIHGKGLCINSALPTFNLPDANGNSRLACTCAPIYKWYIEPKLSAQQREDMKGLAPKVASENCGKVFGGKIKACDRSTVGGCVWTAEDLERDPSYWDKKRGG